MGLSKEQERFVNANDCNVIVSASAGSGKTFTMIEKLCKLIVEKKTEVNKLLVVTFTVSAGNEMKQKLYLKLAELSENGDPYLLEQMDKLDLADIGTLHSICKKIIGKYFYRLNIDPSFVILEPKEVEYLKATAIDNILKKYALKDHDDEYALLYDTFATGRKDDEFRSVIDTLIRYMCSISNKEEWKKNVVKECDKDYDDTVWSNYILENIKKDIVPKKMYFEEAKAFLSVDFSECKAFSAISQICDVICAIEDVRVPSKAGKIFANYDKIDWARPKKVDDFIKEKFDEYKSARDLFNKLIEKSAQSLCYMGDKYVGEIRSYKRAVLKLFEVTDEVEKEYSRLKANKAGVDFNDLENYMLRLLDIPEVVAELRNSYTHIFVDEYQDINEVQETILNKLSSGTNLNMIGDVKQSIYGFRLCTPEIFINKYNRYKTSDMDVAVDFYQNFRSNNVILDAVNYVFGKLITINSMKLDYNSAPLKGGLVTQESDDGLVEFDIIDSSSNESMDSEDESENDTVDYEYEARLVFKKIKEALDPKTVYTDVRSGEKRQYSYKDIAILVRNKRENLNILYSYLVCNNVPVSLSFKNALFNTREINMLYGILKCIHNEYDDISLITYLLSPLVGLTNDELSVIRLADRTKAMHALVLEYDESDQIGKKIAHAKSKLVEYRRVLLSSSVTDLISYILYTDQLYDAFNNETDGDEAMKNVQEFVKLLSGSSVNHNLSLALSYLKLLEDRSDFEISVSDSDSVKIMTMHNSKGLEFPFVILCNLKQGINTRVPNIMLSSDLGVGIKNKDIISRTSKSTPPYTASILRKSLDEGADLIRLFYVAMTRAKNRLVMIGSSDVSKAMQVYGVSPLKCKNFVEMILLSLPKESLAHLATGNNTSVNLPSGKMIINVLKPDEIEAENTQVSSISFGRVLEEDRKKIEELVSQKYAFEADENIAVKNTVTELLHEQNDYENVVYAPKKLVIGESENSDITGAEIGTAYHHLMQAVDYKSIYDLERVKALISSQVEPEMVEYVDAKKILNAIDTISAFIDVDSRVLQEAQFMYRDIHSNIVPDSDSKSSVMVQGVVDLIILGKDNILIDYKTNKFRDSQAFVDHYELQLKIYQNAVEKGYNIKLDHIFIYSFELNTLIKVDK